MKAKHIMRRKVITVSEHQPLQEVARVFLDNRITGAPVVDAQGHIVGVISQTDLVRNGRENPKSPQVPAFYRFEGENLMRGYQVESPDLTPARAVMTPVLFSADEETRVCELARFMLRKRIHRLIITRKRRLCGIVTTMDMLRVVARPQPRAKATSAAAAGRD